MARDVNALYGRDRDFSPSHNLTIPVYPCFTVLKTLPIWMQQHIHKAGYTNRSISYCLQENQRQSFTGRHGLSITPVPPSCLTTGSKVSPLHLARSASLERADAIWAAY